MKIVGLLVCIAVASATHLPHGGFAYGPKHYEPAPLNHDGTVAETPEVAHAKAAHLAEVAKAHAIAAAHPDTHEHHEYEAPVYHHTPVVHHAVHHAPVHHAPKHFEPAPLNHDGTVAHTPEYVHIAHAHEAEHQKAKSVLAHKSAIAYAAPHHYNSYDEPAYHAPAAPVAHYKHFQPAPLNHDGTVAETPEVAHAKAAHLAAHAHALHRYKRSPYYEPAPLKHDGTVDDTPEVKHAKAEHFAALAHAKSQVHSYPYYDVASNYGHYPTHSYAPVHKYYEPAPLNHDGTVADTHAIKEAKAHHFKAHAEAKARLYHVPSYGSYDDHYSAPVVYHPYVSHHHYEPAPLNHDGTVADTPAIKEAKAHHFKAVAEAKARLAYKSALAYSAPYGHAYSAPVEHHETYSHYKHHVPAPLNHDGTVAHTPEYVHIAHAHEAAHHEALARTAYHY